MSVSVSVEKKVRYNININGVQLDEMEKASAWEGFSKYVGKDNECIIVMEFGGLGGFFGAVLGDLFESGKEYILVAGTPETIKKLSDAGVSSAMTCE